MIITLKKYLLFIFLILLFTVLLAGSALHMGFSQGAIPHSSYISYFPGDGPGGSNSSGGAGESGSGSGSAGESGSGSGESGPGGSNNGN